MDGRHVRPQDAQCEVRWGTLVADRDLQEPRDEIILVESGFSAQSLAIAELSALTGFPGQSGPSSASFSNLSSIRGPRNTKALAMFCSLREIKGPTILERPTLLRQCLFGR